MATGMQVWSTTPVNNATSDSNVNWAEGMAPSQVDDSARALMASAAKWVADNSGSLVTSGTSGALTLATNQVEAALTTGFTVTATLGTAISAAATLAVDGLAATSIFTGLSTSTLVSTGQFAANQIVSFVFSTGVGPGNGWVVKANSPPTYTANVLSPLFTTLTNTLGSDVALNNTGSYFDGPSVAQGTTGVWYASGQVTLIDTGGAAFVNVKLWDGTTVIASQQNTINQASFTVTVSLCGTITNPAGNIKISCNDATRTTGAIKFNSSGNSKDSSLTVVRIG